MSWWKIVAPSKVTFKPFLVVTYFVRKIITAFSNASWSDAFIGVKIPLRERKCEVEYTLADAVGFTDGTTEGVSETRGLVLPGNKDHRLGWREGKIDGESLGVTTELKGEGGIEGDVDGTSLVDPVNACKLGRCVGINDGESLVAAWKGERVTEGVVDGSLLCCR